MVLFKEVSFQIKIFCILLYDFLKLNNSLMHVELLLNTIIVHVLTYICTAVTGDVP